MMRSFSERERAKLKCPFCHYLGDYTVILSYQPAFHDSDLLPHAEGYDDLLLSVHECPQCGGCFVHDTPYQEAMLRISLPTSSIAEIKNFVSKHEYPDVYVKRFLFCAYFMEFHSANSFIKAHFWHQAAWAARVRLNSELEQYCLQKALKHYKETHQDRTLMKNIIEQYQYPELEDYIPFIIGEICRRLALFEEAELYFTRINEPKLSMLARKLAELARSRQSRNVILELAT